MTAKELVASCHARARYLHESAQVHSNPNIIRGKRREATELNRAANFAVGFLTAMEGDTDGLFLAFDHYALGLGGPEAGNATRAARVLRAELEMLTKEELT